MTHPHPVQPVIAYETPGGITRVASVRSARIACLLGVLPSVVGVLILFLYWIAWWEWLVMVGILWLTVGGALALAAFLWTIIELVRSRKAVNGKSVRRPLVIGLVASILSVPIAWGCAVVGGDLAMSPHVKLVMYNDTSRRVDRVTVHFSGGDETLGPIDPGKTDSSRVRTHHSPGPLYITVEIAGKKKRTKDRVYADDHHLQQTYDMHIEEKELPSP